MTDRRALLIGINYYGTSNKLNGCINDVNNMQKVLVERLGFSTQKIRRLTDQNKRNRAAMPTRKNIVKCLRALVASAEPFLFFHYSGHGSHVKDLNGDEVDGQDECICPVSGGWIIDDHIRAILDKLKPTQTLFMIFDSCHSGTVADLHKEYYIKHGKPVLVRNTRVTPTNGNIVVLSGCRDDQTSADAWEERQSQGALTYAFRKSLKAQMDGVDGIAAPSPDMISYKRLFKAVVQVLIKNRYSQRAVISFGGEAQSIKDKACFFLMTQGRDESDGDDESDGGESRVFCPAWKLK